MMCLLCAVVRFLECSVGLALDLPRRLQLYLFVGVPYQCGVEEATKAAAWI